MIYHTTQLNPPAAITIAIRNLTYGWIPVRLLAVQGAWVVVDDGQGPLWVLMDQVTLPGFLSLGVSLKGSMRFWANWRLRESWSYEWIDKA